MLINWCHFGQNDKSGIFRGKKRFPEFLQNTKYGHSGFWICCYLCWGRSARAKKSGGQVGARPLLAYLVKRGPITSLLSKKSYEVKILCRANYLDQIQVACPFWPFWGARLRSYELLKTPPKTAFSGQKFSNARYTEWGAPNFFLFDCSCWSNYVELESGIKKICVLNQLLPPYSTALLTQKFCDQIFSYIRHFEFCLNLHNSD